LELAGESFHDRNFSSSPQSASGKGVQQLVLFLVSGGIAALLNWASRFFFSIWMPFEAAVVAAFFVGLSTAFVLMRNIVFHAQGKPLFPQVSRFLVVNIAALVQTFVVSVVLARWALPAAGIVTQAEAIGHFVGVLFPVFTSYIAHRHLTFK
jgi:putative flippase GtrA